MKKIKLLSLALVAFFCGFSIKAKAQTSYFVNGGSMTFIKKIANYPTSGQYTYLWILDGNGWNHDGSHTNWPINKACLDSFNFLDGGHWRWSRSSYQLNSDKSNWSFEKDGSYKKYTMYAIKHGGHGTPKGTIDSLYFTLSKNIETGPGWVFNKAGTPFDSTKMKETIRFDCPVPVKLTAFDAIKNGNFVLLSWTTATELNNSHFEIQKSTDTKKWSTIGIVKSKSEGGNSLSNLYYKYQDSTLNLSKTYYRLYQVDYDGRSEYSHIISLKEKSWYSSPFTVEMYPSPANGGSVVVRLNSPTIENENYLEICSNTGQKVFTSKFTGTSTQIDVSGLIPGFYTVFISSGGFTEKKKLIIQ